MTVPVGSPLESDISSLVLDLNAGAATRTENVEPYALFGDRGGDLRAGDNGLFNLGSNTLELEAFSSTRGRGDLLESQTLDFTIRDDLPNDEGGDTLSLADILQVDDGVFDTHNDSSTEDASPPPRSRPW